MYVYSPPQRRRHTQCDHGLLVPVVDQGPNVVPPGLSTIQETQTQRSYTKKLLGTMCAHRRFFIL